MNIHSHTDQPPLAPPCIRRGIPWWSSTTVLLILILVAAQVTSGFVGGDMMARWWNNQAVKLYQQQQLGEAIDRLESAKEYAAGATQTVLNNLGSLEYEQGKYSSAIEELESAVVECDTATPEEECARGLYNLGNSHYRLGEQVEGDEQRSLWEQAIADYEKALEHNPNDTQAQENIAFIKEKLAQQEDQNSEGLENQDQESGGSDGEEQSNSENQDGEDKEGDSIAESETSQESEGSQSQSGDSEQQSESRPQPQASARAQQQQPLSSQQQAQLKQYMQQMDDNQQRMGQYFRQAPNQQQVPESQDPFGGLFNDPFFSSFFGDQLGTQQFRESNNTGQPDW